MTTPEQLDHVITKKQRGDVTVPQSSEEKLTLDLMELAESFELDPKFDASLSSQFRKAPVRTKDPTKWVNDPVKPNSLLRVFLASAAAMAILTIAVFTIPPLHGFAQQIIDFFVPSDTDKITVELHVGGSASTSSVDLYPLTLDELVNRVDFELPVPTFIPSDYTFNGANYDSNTQSASLNYSCSDYWTIHIVQTRVAELDMDGILSREVGMGAEIERVAIGTATGQYVRGSWIIAVDPAAMLQAEESGTVVTTDAEGSWESNNQWHQLVWHSESVLYTLMGGTRTEYRNSSCSLDKDDFVAIAGGLQLVGSD